MDTLLLQALLRDYSVQLGRFQLGSALLLFFKSWHREEVSLINFLPVPSPSAFANDYFRFRFTIYFTSREPNLKCN